MRSTPYKVLVVDDDPFQLEIYGLLLKQRGYEPVPALVRFNGADFPADPHFHAIILDSCLNSKKSSSEIARQIRRRYPYAPIVLLSDVQWLPTEIAPYVADFVQRGEPGELLGKISALVRQSSFPSAADYPRPLVPCAAIQ